MISCVNLAIVGVLFFFWEVMGLSSFGILVSYLFGFIFSYLLNSCWLSGFVKIELDFIIVNFGFFLGYYDGDLSEACNFTDISFFEVTLLFCCMLERSPNTFDDGVNLWKSSFGNWIVGAPTFATFWGVREGEKSWGAVIFILFWPFVVRGCY